MSILERKDERVEQTHAGLAYPRGQESYDLRTGEEGERPEVLKNIRDVSLPESAPRVGEKGPLTQRWSG